MRFEHLVDRDHRRLPVQRIEDRLDEQQIAAAVEKAAHLFLVRLAQLVERDRAKRRVVDVGGDRERLVRRPDRTCGEARAVWRPRRPFGARLLGETGAPDVELVGNRLEAVIGLGDGRAVERVGLDDVAAGVEVLAVNAGDGVGTRQHEKIVVALEIPRVVLEALAAEVRFREVAALDHRPHRAIEDEDPLLEQPL